MPRRGPVPPREIPPDPIYGSVLIHKLINQIMRKGKKSIAEKIMYGSLLLIHQRTKRNPLDVLANAIRNVMPVVEVRPRRVGGATYQVPMEVRPTRRVSLALRWLVQAARQRKGKTMAHRLADEIIDASNNQGGAVRIKEEVHRIAEANRAFAHYRWF